MNIMQMTQMISQLKSNPQTILQRMGIPQEHLNNPQDALQYLLNSGKVNQSQIDQLNNLMAQFKR